MKRKASLTVNRMTTHPCPGCGAHLEGATGVKIGSEAGEMPPAPVPKEGDITICCYCGALLKYGPSLSVLKTSEEEERQVLATPYIGDLLRWRRALVAQRAVARN